MEPQRWQRLERLFEAAEPLPPAERTAFLDAAFAAAPDPGLRREVEEMLRSDPGEDGSEVAVAIAEGLQVWAESERPPSHLGPYRILREIGRGGMATVYEAERDDREFERKVAVKVIRRGMDSVDIVRRLRRERQILANLDHPNIARLLDGGTTQDGRPYVVMEYIDGEPIDLYCRRRGLGLDERLRLFRQICEAVHFAHRNLVLHRDIKPSNILVTGEGVPKLLDFGIAKVVAGGGEPDVADEPTRTGMRLLTPEWASPEQVRGEPLTTASDVYSLGLLLYLLVAGHRAYEVDPKRSSELERIVCEVDPPPPRRSGQTTGPLVHFTRRWAPALLAPADDLDVVVMVALRKDPARRYASAEQLSEDVRRFLEKLPIGARKDTLSYRTGVFVRRNRLVVIFVAATFVTLLTTALVAVGQARAARLERQRAEENLQLAEDQRERAEQVANLLVGIFEVSDPGEARGRTLTAREVLDQGAQRIRGSLASDPDLRAELLGTIGRVYQKLALYGDAEPLLEEANRLRQGLDPKSPKAAATLRNLAQLAIDRGHYERAEALAQEALALFRQSHPPDPLEISRSLLQIADVEIQLDRLAAAEGRYAEALAMQENSLGPDADEVSRTRNRLGELLYRRGSYEPARALFEGVLASRRRRLGADHPEVGVSLNNLAAAELALRRLPEAEAHLSEVLALRRKIYGESHDEVAGALNNLAAVQSERGDPKAAIASMDTALGIYRKVLGPDHPRVADSLHNLGKYHHSLMRVVEARELYEEALSLRRKIYGSGNPMVAQTLRNLGDLTKETAPDQAEAYFREALAIDRQALPGTDRRLASSLIGLGRQVLRRGDLAEAELCFRQAMEVQAQASPADPQRSEAEGLLGYVLMERAPGAEGRALLEGSVASLEKTLGADHPTTQRMAALLDRRSRPGARP